VLGNGPYFFHLVRLAGDLGGGNKPVNEEKEQDPGRGPGAAHKNPLFARPARRGLPNANAKPPSGNPFTGFLAGSALFPYA
jgi:hypothetical protein